MAVYCADPASMRVQLVFHLTTGEWATLGNRYNWYNTGSTKSKNERVHKTRVKITFFGTEFIILL